MLQWNELHPYNAVHVVRIREALDLPRLTSVINRTLEDAGLTGLSLNRVAGTYEYHRGAGGYEVKSVASGNDPLAAMAAEIEHQLNSPFPDDPAFKPFRFFTLPEQDCFSLGLAYFHPVADAEACVFVLKAIADAYRARQSKETRPVDVYPGSRDNLLRQPSLLARKLLSLPGFIRNMRRSCRPRYRDSSDLHVGFVFFSLDASRLSALLSATRSWGVTMNDLFLALLMKAVFALANERRRERRRKVSVGCIVNARKDHGLSGAGTFGLFLGSFIVTHDLPASIGLQNLAADIRDQTEAIKRNRLYLGAPLEMAFGRMMFSLFSTGLRKKLYEKNYPLWGGITNMNLNAIWEQDGDNGPADYFRAVSTGPATPLVLSVTTVQDRINIGITYRTTVFSPADIEQMKNYFLTATSQPGVPS